MPHEALGIRRLLTALLEQQMSFILLIWGIEARLLMDGLAPFTIDLAPVLESLQQFAIQTRNLARPQLAYSAG